MSEFSYNDVLKLIPKARPRKLPEPQCDPILEHCIKLRKFQDEVEHLILLTANLKEVYDDSEREPVLNSLPPVPELPELVNKIPDKNQENLELEEIELSEGTIMKLVSKAIARVLVTLGYTDIPSQLLQDVSKIIIEYIKSLSEVMVKLMPEHGSIPVDLLEAALQQKGINGIEELYSFYTQRVVKFHNSLYLKCKHLCEDLKNNLKKPDAPPQTIIAESSTDEECSIDVNEEANIEASNKGSLDSGELAEELYSRRKLKRKSVRFALQTENCEINIHKDSHEATIATDQENCFVKNAVCSESFSNLEPVFTEDTVSLEHAKYDLNLSNEPAIALSEINSKVTGLVSNSIDLSDDEPSERDANIVTDEEKIPVELLIVCYSDDEPLDQSTSIVTDEKRDSYKNAIGSVLNEEPLHPVANSVTDKEDILDKNGIGSEFYSNSENLSTENIVSYKCTEPISDLSIELNSAVSKYCKKISCESVSYSNDKPLRNRKVKRKAVDLKNRESLSDSSKFNEKKRHKIMKYRTVSGNDTNMLVRSPKMEDNFKKLELSNSSVDSNMGSILHDYKLGIIPEENICNNYHNAEAYSKLEISSSTKNDCEIIVPDVSSSSENETEQIWVSL